MEDSDEDENGALFAELSGEEEELDVEPYEGGPSMTVSESEPDLEAYL